MKVLYFRIEIIYYANSLIIEHTTYMLKNFASFKTFLNILYEVIKAVSDFAVHTVAYALG